MTEEPSSTIKSPLDQLVAYINGLHDFNHRSKINFTDPIDFKHHNFKEMTDFLNEYVEKCQRISRLYSVGKSVQGRDLWVMEITDNPGHHEPGNVVFEV